MTINIPTDLDRWNPAEVTDWLAQLDNDDTITEADYAAAQQAGAAALLDTEG